MRGCRCSMIMGFTKPIEHFILQRKKVITMNTLYVGIDVSSKSNVVYLMLPNGDKHSNFSVANSHEGSTQLVKRILSALTSHSLDTVLIGLEATSVYGDNLVYFLREDATLAPFNRKIHVLNPKQVKKFHDAYNDLPKNDYVDSFVIADCLRFGRINKEVYLGDYRYKALQNLTRARFFAVQNLIKEKQRFMNVLFKKYSTMTQEKVFSDTFSTTALAVYDEFDSAEALANMDLHELTDFIIEKGKNRFPDPDAVAKAIQKAARSSYRLPKTVNDSVNQVLSISITSMKALESQIKECAVSLIFNITTASYSDAVVNVGYKEFNLILASSVRNCQFTFAATVFRSTSHADNSLRRFEILSILLFKHCLVMTLSSISAISSQLPCFDLCV